MASRMFNSNLRLMAMGFNKLKHSSIRVRQLTRSFGVRLLNLKKQLLAAGFRNLRQFCKYSKEISEKTCGIVKRIMNTKFR